VVHLVLLVDRQSGRLLELAGAAALAPKLGQEAAALVEQLDAVVAPVADEQAAEPVERHAPRPAQLAVLAALGAEAEQRLRAHRAVVAAQPHRQRERAVHDVAAAHADVHLQAPSVHAHRVSGTRNHIGDSTDCS